jgi:hypothetical protein
MKLTAVARWLEVLRAAAVSNIPDTLLVAGAGSVAYGAWLVYAPAGFITAGVLLLVAGVLASRAKAARWATWRTPSGARRPS